MSQIENLKKLKELQEAGIISQEEFDEQKRVILEKDLFVEPKSEITTEKGNLDKVVESNVRNIFKKFQLSEEIQDEIRNNKNLSWIFTGLLFSVVLFPLLSHNAHNYLLYDIVCIYILILFFVIKTKGIILKFFSFLLLISSLYTIQDNIRLSEDLSIVVEALQLLLIYNFLLPNNTKIIKRLSLSIIFMLLFPVGYRSLHTVEEIYFVLFSISSILCLFTVYCSLTNTNFFEKTVIVKSFVVIFVLNAISLGYSLWPRGVYTYVEEDMYDKLHVVGGNEILNDSAAYTRLTIGKSKKVNKYDLQTCVVFDQYGRFVDSPKYSKGDLEKIKSKYGLYESDIRIVKEHAKEREEEARIELSRNIFGYYTHIRHWGSRHGW